MLLVRFPPLDPPIGITYLRLFSQNYQRDGRDLAPETM